MISPHTPPGTEIVAVVDNVAAKGLPPLVKGRIYTVWKIIPTDDGFYGVVVREHGPGRFFETLPWWKFWKRPKRFYSCWALKAFRYLDKAASPEFYATKEPRRVEKKVGVLDHAMRGLRGYYAALVEESRPRAWAALRRAVEACR
jgi:hypothetical protein